jgi:hypothetical protein
VNARKIIAELPKLSHAERRKVARRLFELESDAPVLADADRRANQNFLLLDAMESEMAHRGPRKNR